MGKEGGVRISFFPHSVTYMFSHWTESSKASYFKHPKPQNGKYQGDSCLLGITSPSHLYTGDAASEGIWGSVFAQGHFNM